ncbi:unnamed protein product [Thlaspi arvense]|uniref:Uncharacterized protein n=1 Tax=Thlaspi arvense TaxID=13288 RepID=A0AAU9SDU1_THLAR|nr:unnamed protein product [Thlaspi arvense]
MLVLGRERSLGLSFENFMCHSNLQIEFGECVNFITGQTEVAVLTALCVAFGCQAKGTQRASLYPWEDLSSETGAP